MERIAETDSAEITLGAEVAVERASTGQRTVMIVLAQVVVLAVIAVAWSILRVKRSSA